MSPNEHSLAVVMGLLCRSLPDLELVKEFSLLPELRWNFKPNTERLISSAENLHIALVIVIYDLFCKKQLSIVFSLLHVTSL